MPLKKQRAQIAVEIESVEGTAETLVAADVILAFNPSFTPEIAMTERDPVRSSLSPWASIPGKRSARISFTCEMTGTAAAGDSVHYADALKACGVQETLVPGTSATYVPASDSVPSVTVGYYMDGKFHKIWGARGTARFIFRNGEPGMINFEFTGADWSVTDASLLSGVTYEATIPPAFMDVTFTVDSYSACFSGMEIDMGNTVQLRECVASESGHVSALITDRKTTLTVDPEDVLEATEDFLRIGAVVIWSLYPGRGDLLLGILHTFSADKVQYQSIRQGDRNSLATLDISGMLTQTVGDDEWEYQIT